MFSFLLLGLAVGAIITERSDSFKLLNTPEALALEDPLPFPDWLADFTGLTQWPGMEPPYIPLDYIDFSKIPAGSDSWIHTQGNCDAGFNNPEVCSFDCWACWLPEDVRSCPKLSQTFDDGPSPFTLDLIEKVEIPLTFFTIGVNVVRFPQIYRDTANKGHVMGSHTWSHKFLPSLSNEQIIAELEWSVWAMNATHGHIPKWFRPPYGGIDNRVRAILRHFGMQAVLWDFDSLDWALASNQGQETENELQQRVRDFSKAHGNSGLILEHDSFERTVQIGMGLYDVIGNDQMTVSQCVQGQDYIETLGVGPGAVPNGNPRAGQELFVMGSA